VRNLQTSWASLSRRRVFRLASSLCDKFLPTIETHATLLATLTNSDTDHDPIFYGVLQSVLKVGSLHSVVLWQPADARGSFVLGIGQLPQSDGRFGHSVA